jgi:hypothetical protein
MSPRETSASLGKTAIRVVGSTWLARFGAGRKDDADALTKMMGGSQQDLADRADAQGSAGGVVPGDGVREFRHHHGRAAGGMRRPQGGQRRASDGDKLDAVSPSLPHAPSLYIVTMDSRGMGSCSERPCRGLAAFLTRASLPHRWICVACGLFTGLAIGLVTEYYTSNSYKPVQEVTSSRSTSIACARVCSNVLLHVPLSNPWHARTCAQLHRHVGHTRKPS